MIVWDPNVCDQDIRRVLVDAHPVNAPLDQSILVCVEWLVDFLEAVGGQNAFDEKGSFLFLTVSSPVGGLLGDVVV